MDIHNESELMEMADRVQFSGDLKNQMPLSINLPRFKAQTSA